MTSEATLWRWLAPRSSRSDLHAVLSEVGAEQVVIVGHSMGEADEPEADDKPGVGGYRRKAG